MLPMDQPLCNSHPTKENFRASLCIHARTLPWNNESSTKAHTIQISVFVLTLYIQWNMFFEKDIDWMGDCQTDGKKHLLLPGYSVSRRFPFAMLPTSKQIIAPSVTEISYFALILSYSPRKMP